MSAGKWQQVADAKAFLEQRGSVRRAPHRMSKWIISWPYCATCGLVGLKNDATRKALKQLCEWEE